MKTTYAYIAGFIDGEGFIGITKIKKSGKYITQVGACNCNQEVIEYLNGLFGGKVRKRDWKGKAKNNWKANYEWKLTHQKAAAFIRAIQPYLRVKKQQAALVLEAQVLKQKYSKAWMRWHPDAKTERDQQLERLRHECGRLNHRGRTKYQPDSPDSFGC